MHKKVLVASPNPPFGALVRRSLEETGRYQVRVAESCSQAEVLLTTDAYDLVVLDIDLRDGSAPQCLSAIRQGYPHVPLAIFPPNNDPAHPWLAGFENIPVLKKPFYLPELISILDACLDIPPTSWPGAPGRLEDNLMDVERVLQRFLQRFLAETEARAALLLLEGEVLLRCGELQKDQAIEIAAIVHHSWNAEQRGDLVRFNRLKAGGEEVLLYATQGDEQIVLVLVFSPQTGLRTARTVASHAHQAFRDLSEPLLTMRSERMVLEGAPTTAIEDPMENDAPLELEEMHLDELLEHAPAPDPRLEPAISPDWVPEEELAGGAFQFPWEKEGEKLFSGDAASGESNPGVYPVDMQSDTALTDSGAAVYTCILLPRHPQLKLVAALKTELETWLPGFFALYGWHLESFRIEPDYLQWTMRIRPEFPPAELIRALRQQSSRHLAETILQISAEDEDDYWAPGYLLVSGAMAPAPQYIEGFIRQTRRRQGFLVD